MTCLHRFFLLNACIMAAHKSALLFYNTARINHCFHFVGQSVLFQSLEWFCFSLFFSLRVVLCAYAPSTHAGLRGVCMHNLWPTSSEHATQCMHQHGMSSVWHTRHTFHSSLSDSVVQWMQFFFSVSFFCCSHWTESIIVVLGMSFCSIPRRQCSNILPVRLCVCVWEWICKRDRDAMPFYDRIPIEMPYVRPKYPIHSRTGIGDVFINGVVGCFSKRAPEAFPLWNWIE